MFWADELPDLEAATRLSWMAGRWAAWAGDNPDKPWMREREAGWTRLASLAAGGLEIGQTSPHPDGWSHRG